MTDALTIEGIAIILLGNIIIVTAPWPYWILGCLYVPILFVLYLHELDRITHRMRY